MERNLTYWLVICAGVYIVWDNLILITLSAIENITITVFKDQAFSLTIENVLQNYCYYILLYFCKYNII
jgi:hypothetical protein